MPVIRSPWLAPDRAKWESAVDLWLNTVAEQNGLGGIRDWVTLKERPWSLVRRVNFDNGTHYFKACSAAGQYEPALLLFLNTHSIPNMPDLIAADLTRKWMLMSDSGLTLRDTFTIADQVKILGPALAAYAELQIASLEWVDQLLEMGLPDRRLTRLPTLLESLLSSRVMEVGHSFEEVERVRSAASSLIPKFEKACAKLSEAPYTNALEHGDFHTRNILMKEDVATIIDWGDACITHPFCSILVTLEWMQDQLPPQERERSLDCLRGAYLEPWAARYPLDMLLRDMKRALWIAHVGRALDFDHMFAGADEETLNQWRPMIFERLVRWVQRGPPINS